MRNQIKKICILFFAFLFSSSLFVDVFAVESLEEGAREKRLGVEDSTRDTIHIRRQKFLSNIDSGDIEKIKIYLKRYDNEINFVTIKGFHPLVRAARSNNIKIVDLFLSETKVNINSQDLLGDTPLIKAAGNGYVEMVEYLINKGANINRQNKGGQTAAMKAVAENHYYVLKILLNKNIDLNKSDYTGRTIKDIAKNSRDKRILQLLN